MYTFILYNSVYLLFKIIWYNKIKQTCLVMNKTFSKEKKDVWVRSKNNMNT